MKKLRYLLLFICITTYSCQNSESEADKTIHPVQHIKVSPVERIDMVDTVSIYGQIKLRQEALLASQFDGRLTEFTLLPGDHVDKNQKIGLIIPPQREALLQVLNQIDNTMRPMLEEQIKSIPLISPINGVVLEVLRHSGDVLQKGETIVHIGDLKHLDVYGDLPTHFLPLVNTLKHIQVEFVDYPHKPLSLLIEAIGGKVDQFKQTVSLRLEMDNLNGEFRPGMQVRLTFPGQVEKNALVIPRAALLEEEGIYSVFVVKGNQVERRTIEIGIINNDRVEVRSGLREGELLATQKAYSLTDGMDVIVE
jgi:multidrug efflux pump subunit AcrA (membrane-fusion protein)